MSGIFSAVDRPYNTITSPDQQDAAATGNDQGPTDQAPDQSPMAKIMAAVMRGAGRVQGQEQAKQVATDQMVGNEGVKLAFTGKKTPGGVPFIKFEGPVDVINGTQQSDLIAAHDTPGKQVEQKLNPQAEAADNAPAPSAPAPTTPQPPDHPLEQVAAKLDASKGYRIPRPWDPDIQEKLKTEAGLTAIAAEMGDPNPKADGHRAWRQIQHGVATREEVAQRLADYRAHRIEAESQHLEAALAPTERDAERKQAETDRQDRITLAKEEEQRRLRSQSDTELAAGNKEKLDWLKTTDLSTVDPAQLEETARSSTNAVWTASDINRAKLKQQQDVNKAFLDYTDTKKDTFALGNQPTWEAAKEAFGHPLTPDQDRMGKARWQAAHTYAIRKAADDASMQEARAAKLEHLQYLNEHQGDVKPVPLDDSFVKGVSASDILSVLPTVKNPDLVLQRKEALLRNEIQDRSEKLRKAQADARSVNETPATQRKYGWETQLVNYQVDAKTHADRITAAKDELQQIEGARAARAGGKPVVPATKPPSSRPANPTKGQTWQGPTGVQTFDGRGWVQ